MFQDPSHSKASGLDTYNIYGCLQHLAEASHRDWWVGSACGTPFVPLSRGRLLSLAVDSIFGDWDISFRDLQGKENAAVHPKIAFLVVATFLNPIQSIYIYIHIKYVKLGKPRRCSGLSWCLLRSRTARPRRAPLLSLDLPKPTFINAGHARSFSILRIAHWLAPGYC